MLVIRSKTVLLQENLQHAESQKNKLIEVLAQDRRVPSTLDISQLKFIPNY